MMHNWITSVFKQIRNAGLQYLDSNLFQGIQCDRCNENLYWWIQLDKYLHLNTGCCYKDSVKKKEIVFVFLKWLILGRVGSSSNSAGFKISSLLVGRKFRNDNFQFLWMQKNIATMDTHNSGMRIFTSIARKVKASRAVKWSSSVALFNSHLYFPPCEGPKLMDTQLGSI